MPEHWTSAELLSQVRGGDERAADELFHRYLERLTRLARTRLSPRLAARTDPEDIVLSAWRSFFVGARAGRYALRRSGDLWRLLASIVMHKLYHAARRHAAGVRSVAAELPGSAAAALPDARREPTPEEALALADEVQAVMKQLDAFKRRVLELRLQGEPLAEIAADTGRSERTVRRTLAELRQMLARRLGRSDDE